MADLFAYIDSEVGLDKSLIVLSADHGVDEAPERRQKLGFEAGRLRPQEFMAAVNSALQKRFGCIETLLVPFLIRPFTSTGKPFRNSGWTPSRSKPPWPRRCAPSPESHQSSPDRT